MSAVKGPFAPVIAVRKGRNAVHLSQQNGTTVDGGLMAVVPLFTDTLCGRSIGWSGWNEVQEAATCQHCERLNSGIEWARNACIAEAHDAALAEDVRRTGCVCTDRDGFGHTCAGYPNGTPVGDVIADVWVRQPDSSVTHKSDPESADTICGKQTGRDWIAVPSAGSFPCRACVAGKSWSQLSGNYPQWQTDEVGTGLIPDDTRLAEETSAPAADRVPTRWGIGCEYCKRYRRACGRHEDDALSGPVAAAVDATSAMLGADAGPHLRELYSTVVVDTAAQDRIAAAYDALPLLPDHDAAPLVGHAYRAMAAETLAQAAVLRELGIRWSVVDTDPYSTAGEMFAELRETGSIRVLSSRVTGGHAYWNDHTNDTFRAVHDILGHAATGRGFDRHGEEAAYQAHSVLYSPLARLALASETRGQNASMLRAGGVFPPQKIGVLPEWARATDALTPDGYAWPALADDAARDHAAQGLGTWNA